MVDVNIHNADCTGNINIVHIPYPPAASYITDIVSIKREQDYDMMHMGMKI